MTRPLKTTVLISGSGSNLQALIDARQSGSMDIDINHVISNVPDAKGLERAENAGIRTSILEHGAFSSRDDFDRALALLIAAGEPDLVVLAGFMRIIGPEILEPFQRKNDQPAPFPAAALPGHRHLPPGHRRRRLGTWSQHPLCHRGTRWRAGNFAGGNPY